MGSFCHSLLTLPYTLLNTLLHLTNSSKDSDLFLNELMLKFSKISLMKCFLLSNLVYYWKEHLDKYTKVSQLQNFLFHYLLFHVNPKYLRWPWQNCCLKSRFLTCWESIYFYLCFLNGTFLYGLLKKKKLFSIQNFFQSPFIFITFSSNL